MGIDRRGQAIDIPLTQGENFTSQMMNIYWTSKT